MEEILIYKYQLEAIKDTLRMTANVLKSHSKETCLDRCIMKSIEMVDDTLKKSKTK